MKHRNFFQLFLFGLILTFFASSCVKEGPLGPEGAAGADGTDGTDGKDANETCIICHAPGVVDKIAVEFQLSKHEYGLAAEEEAGNTTCAPCHEQEGFKYVVANNVKCDFILGTNGKYTNGYVATSGTAYGKLLCATCHSSIHKTYASSDLPALTTTAPVALTMWGGKKTINLAADNGSSNLCVKCHQPRPQTNLQTGNSQDYEAIAANPKGIAHDTLNTTNNIINPSYRMDLHYGTVGTAFAGVGGVEFAGTMGYSSSPHASVASCTDCHMGTGVVGKAGGHTFFAKGNFTTCNTAGCHQSPINDSNITYWIDPRAKQKELLEALAAKLVVNGVEILNQSDDEEANLWYALTSKHYDGYLNVYDPSLNPGGNANETGSFRNSAPGSAWTQAQKDKNNKLPKLQLTNAQYGAILNFQFCLREYSLGIHNSKYTKALLTNSIAVL